MRSNSSKAGNKTTSRMMPRRSPGRPGRDAPNATEINKELLLARALELTRKEPLQDISMLRLAREFGVTPALIHYYLHGINRLHFGVINLYNRRLLEALPERTGFWRADIEGQFTVTYNFMIEYSGITAYLIAHNRFRLIEEIADDEVDYGLLRFEIVARTFQEAGFSPDDAALNFHLISQFTMSCAHAFSLHQLPFEHKSFFHKSFLSGQLSKLDRKQAPGIYFILKSFLQVDADKVFRRGLTMHLDDFETVLKAHLRKPSATMVRNALRKKDA